MAKKAVITPAQYLKERYEMSDTSPAALMKAYTTLKNIPDSEVFNHLAEYWSNQASHSGSIVLMVQMWYYGKAHRYGDRRFI